MTDSVTVRPVVAELLEEYLGQDVNFGSDSHEVRLAESDAFLAGWDSCLQYLLNAIDSNSHVPEKYREMTHNVSKKFTATVKE